MKLLAEGRLLGFWRYLSCQLLAAMAKAMPLVVLYLLLSFPARTVSVSLGGAVLSHLSPTFLAYVVAFVMLAALLMMMVPVRGMLVPTRGWSAERLHRAHPSGDPARRREPGYILRLLAGRNAQNMFVRALRV